MNAGKNHVETTPHMRKVETTACATNPVSQGRQGVSVMFSEPLYVEMEEAFGILPSFFARMSDATI
jgi:hypothetical protein